MCCWGELIGKAGYWTVILLLFISVGLWARSKFIWTWGELIGKAGFWTVVFLLFVVPLLWILSVSLQANDVTKGGHYLLYPDPPSIDTYMQILVQDQRGFRTALLYSFWVSLISTVFAMVVALSAVYLIIAQVLSFPWRRRTVQAVVGLYFLPAFTVYPGIQAIAAACPPLKSSMLQLVVVHSTLGFVIAFILLLLAYTSVPHFHFEQLLLETRSRLTAFWRGVVRLHITEPSSLQRSHLRLYGTSFISLISLQGPNP